MKTTNLFPLVAFLLTLISTNLIAQDDLYFDPNTDADLAISNRYEVEEDYADEYVDEAFDDNQYFEDDFYYSRRIRRFNRFQGRSFGYFSPWFNHNYYYDSHGFYSPFGPSVIVYNPFSPWWMRPNSFYGNYGFNRPWGNPYGWNSGFYGWNNNFYGFNNFYDPYFCPVQGVNVGIVNNNYYDSRSYGPRSVRGGVVDIQGNARTGKYGRDTEAIGLGNSGRTQATFDSGYDNPTQGTRTTEGLSQGGNTRTSATEGLSQGSGNTKTNTVEGLSQGGGKTRSNSTSGLSQEAGKSDGKVKTSTTRETRRNKWRQQFQQRPRTQSRSSSTRSNSSRSNNRSYDSGSSRTRSSSTRSNSSSRSNKSSSSRSSSSGRSPR